MSNVNQHDSSLSTEEEHLCGSKRRFCLFAAITFILTVISTVILTTISNEFLKATEDMQKVQLKN
jgi:hypothetical protein